jgi:hypothetical protein
MKTRNFGIRNCEICGREFEAFRDGHHHCSDKCAQKARYKKARQAAGEKPPVMCDQCGETIPPRRRMTKGKHFCSATCKQRYYQAEKDASKETVTMSQTCCCCGKVFTYAFDSHYRIYCSRECRIKKTRQNTSRHIRFKRTSGAVKANCPRCKRDHYINIEYIGTGTPRFFCVECAHVKNHNEFEESRVMA